LLGDRRDNWQTADRSSAGLLPKASEHPDALIRMFAARTARARYEGVASFFEMESGASVDASLTFR
jgi:hypothetical protein